LHVSVRLTGGCVLKSQAKECIQQKNSTNTNSQTNKQTNKLVVLSSLISNNQHQNHPSFRIPIPTSSHLLLHLRVKSPTSRFPINQPHFLHVTPSPLTLTQQQTPPPSHQSSPSILLKPRARQARTRLESGRHHVPTFLVLILILASIIKTKNLYT
jgi:hypothetical protein